MDLRRPAGGDSPDPGRGTAERHAGMGRQGAGPTTVADCRLCALDVPARNVAGHPRPDTLPVASTCAAQGRPGRGLVAGTRHDERLHEHGEGTGVRSQSLAWWSILLLTSAAASALGGSPSTPPPATRANDSPAELVVCADHN